MRGGTERQRAGKWAWLADKMPDCVSAGTTVEAFNEASQQAFIESAPKTSTAAESPKALHACLEDTR